eukprot:TRINITY_DN46354_c0_g1_i1.p1 TRINITY_DN46354_c0_g1~~TRINITY_DN46354_c0_g1_i1.p1  ORF type:complete len:300 (+),score=53.88 TRINITY_DN46354_c0_g1_i1:50-949(+)
MVDTGKWRVICFKPLIIDCPDFLDANECLLLRRAAYRSPPAEHSQDGKAKFFFDASGSKLPPEEGAVLRKVLSGVASLLDTPQHGGEAPARCDFTAPEVGGRCPERRLPLGLHLDTNRRPRRFATAILYLSTLPPESDGATAFPCARPPGKLAGTTGRGSGFCGCSEGNIERDAMKAAQTLLAGGCEHTATASDVQAAQVLQQAAVRRCGLSVAPVAGRLVIFFGRDHRGAVEPAAFHGGCGVLTEPNGTDDDGLPVGKWTMQIFKEVPQRAPCSVEEYAAERWRAIVSARHGKSGKQT